MAVGRETGARGYKLLKGALRRIRSSRRTRSTRKNIVRAGSGQAEQGEGDGSARARPETSAPTGRQTNEPRRVATPMSIPLICRTATTQDAAASPSVAVSVAVVVPASDQALRSNSARTWSRASRWGESLTAEKMKECYWVKPRLVCQIAFVEWTDAGHLRHCTFVAMRDDKKPAEVVRETWVRSMSESCLPVVQQS
jgi:hypothetical protein